MRQEGLDIALQHEPFKQASAESLPAVSPGWERRGEVDDVDQAKAGDGVVQRANVVVVVFVGVLIVVVVDAEDDGAIAVGGRIQIAQHVVPGARIAPGAAGAAEYVSRLRG